MKRFLVALLLLTLPGMFGFQVAPTGDTNARIKSVFIYNFTRYIDWPADYKSGNFVIHLYGSNSSVLTELTTMATSKTVGAQKIEIKNTKSLDGITGKIHILYVTPDITIPLSEIVSKIKGKATLLVTEKKGYANQGSAINFVVVENRQKFELNQNNAVKHDLKVSSSLVALAIPVQ